MKKTLRILSALLILHFSQFTFAQVSTTAIFFDGLNDLVTIPNHPAYSFGSSDFTIEAWVRDNVPNTSFSQENIIRSDVDFGCQICTSAISFRIENGSLEMMVNGQESATATNQDLRDGLCHHVAAVVDWSPLYTASYIYLYVDGSYAGEQLFFSPDNIQFQTSLHLGNMLKGTLKELRMWNVARTAAQIHDNMNTVLSSSQPNLIAYWRMNDGSGQAVNDYSANNNDATLGSGANSTLPAWTLGCCNAICSPPAGLFTSNITSTKAKLNWTPQNCAIGYLVRYKPSGGQTWTNLNVNGGLMGYKNIKNLSPNTTYVWQVRTKCSSNANVFSLWTANSSFTTAMRMSESENPKPAFSVYPNPATDHLTITTDASIEKIIIQNSLGQVVSSQNFNTPFSSLSNEVGVSSLPTGIYFISIVTAKGECSKMFVKQ